MQRSVHREDPAHTAIAGAALFEVEITMRSDASQTFVPKAAFHEVPDWTYQITCAKLAQIVLHYFGPQITTTQTIEQAFRAIPFVYDIFNRHDENAT